ncbi:MAG: ABC transporter permease [Streptosporangiaceae bacterium]
MIPILRKRLPLYLVTAWAAITMNFVIPRLMPGNPAELLLNRLNRAGSVPVTSLAAVEAEFGLSSQGTWWHQYLSYFGHVLSFNLGVSLTYFPEPVSQVIAQTLPWTVILVLTGLVISWLLGLLLGIVLGWRRGSHADSLLVPTSTFFSAIPFFLVGLVLVWGLGVVLRILPINGAYGPTVTIGPNAAFVGSWLRHAILPVLTIVASSFVGHMLHMRNMMVTTLGEDYVLMAEAKGLSRRRIKYAYAARNAILPSVASFTIALGFVVGGSVLVETVFSYPGIGYALFQAVNNEDYPLMQGIFLVIALTVLVANLCADVVYAVLDPRSRQQLSS